MKKGDLTKRTKMFNARLLPEEIEIIKRYGFGNITAGLRRMIEMVIKKDDKKENKRKGWYF